MFDLQAFRNNAVDEKSTNTLASGHSQNRRRSKRGRRPTNRTRTIAPVSFASFPQRLLASGDDLARVSSTATVPSGDVTSSDVPAVTTAGTASSPLNQSSRNRTISSSSQASSVGSNGQHRVGVTNPEDASRPLYKKDALFNGSKQQLHHLSRTSLHNSNPYVASVTDIPKAVTEEKKKESAAKAFANILAAMTDFSILKNKQMLLICIGNVFSMLGYYLPIMCLVSFASEDLGVKKSHASFLLTIFGTCAHRAKPH